MIETLKSDTISRKFEAEKNLEQLIKDLAELSSLDSFSGQEQNLRNRLRLILEGIGLDCFVDDKGNLWVESDNEEQKNILLSAHMDKVGQGNEVRVEGNRLTGRLDDALGLSIILSLIRQGLRPSVVFTVEEEAQIEVEKDGQRQLELRELPNGIYNAGARYVAEKLAEKNDKPKLVIVVDVTQMGKVGDGPIVYTSSGLKKPGKQFYFSPEMLKKVARVINPEKLGVSYLEGNANDSIEFTFVPGVGVLAVEVPVNNNHTSNEEADIKDVNKTVEILRKIITNASNF